MLTHRFDDALGFAVAAHREHTRKSGTIPYMSHLMAVCALTLEYGGDEDCAIAALLHDAVEDQGGPAMAERIKAAFGPRVHDIVLACSDSDGAEKAPWKDRKTAYIDSLATKSEDAFLVTTCDKIHNVTAIYHDLQQVGLSVFARFTAGQEDVLWYYRSLAEAITTRRQDALSARFAQAVRQLEEAVTERLAA